jgi:magnesium-transporting ATPase (P-type)
VLVLGGWSWGQTPGPALLATASGSAFAVIAVCQMANAFACRSSTVPVWRVPLRSNPLLIAAVGAEALLLVAFVGVPWLVDLLGGSWPSATGWTFALVAAGVLLFSDSAHKWLRRGRISRAGGPFRG